MKTAIAKAERILVDVPFNERPMREMNRGFWWYSCREICRVESDSGHVGYGEAMAALSWTEAAKEQMERVTGKNPFELLWDDSLGAGLQMAIWDLAGKMADVPCYRLIGDKVRDLCPIEWFGIEMSPEDFAKECCDAVELGYTSAKLKAWGWRDVIEHVERVSEVVPDNFKINLDFNGMLMYAGQALPILVELSKNPKVNILESPIPQDDIHGNIQIRSHVPRSIAMHYGRPPIMTALEEQVCDGFVLGGEGKAGQLRRQVEVLAEAKKPFWIQSAGTGLLTAYILHWYAASTQAVWPAVTCCHTFADDLLKEGFAVESGFARVPEGPGLGVEIDEEALARYQVALPYERPEPTDVYCLIWPDGRRVCYASGEALLNDFQAGLQPAYSRGIRMETYEDDGSQDFRRMREKARYAPLRKGATIKWK